MKRLVGRQLAALLTSIALLFSLVASVSGAVWTDQEDYSPGSVVTISGDNSNGAGYLPGETVLVEVAGPNGYTSSCTATVADSGAWSCQVTLWDSLLAVGDYTYTATGLNSGTSESGTFSDAVQVTITGATFVWYTANSFDLAVSGTYTCTGTVGAAGCNDADDVTVTIHEGDGSPNSAGGSVGDRTKILSVETTGSDIAWGYTFKFRPIADEADEYVTPADGKFDVKAVFHGKLSAAARADDDIEDNYFGIDTTLPTSTIDTDPSGDMPTADGTATDPGSDTPLPHFSGFENNPKPIHAEIRTDPGDVLVPGTGLDLTLAALGATKQSGDWAYDYANTGLDPLEPGDYCLVVTATDVAGNVQDPATTSCWTVEAPPKLSSSTSSTLDDQEITLGQSVTDTAVVTGSADGDDPTGDVEFYLCGPTGLLDPDPDCSTGGSLVTTVALTSDGESTTYTASASSGVITPGAIGRYCIRAAYLGDSLYDPSEDYDSSECFIVVAGSAGPTITALGAANLWVGLKNSDDQGTRFDIGIELWLNGTQVGEGLARCVQGVTRNATRAVEVTVPWTLVNQTEIGTNDLTFKVKTRIGTNGDDTKCTGHSNAVGLRLYYDAVARDSGFGMTISPDPADDWYLHSDGNACVNAESTGVTDRYADTTAPTATSAKCKDSAGINFAGGNDWQYIGTWDVDVS
jgi:hypothetical protein